MRKGGSACWDPNRPPATAPRPSIHRTTRAPDSSGHGSIQGASRARPMPRGGARGRRADLHERGCGRLPTFIAHRPQPLLSEHERPLGFRHASSSQGVIWSFSRAISALALAGCSR